MYLFQYVCHVDPEGELARDSRFDDIGGAYLNVWIAFADVEGAEELSRFYARRAGWAINRTVGTWQIDAQNCLERDKALFTEASEYGYCTAAYMWAKNAPDADTSYEDVRAQTEE
jgi:hypothetical protein